MKNEICGMFRPILLPGKTDMEPDTALKEELRRWSEERDHSAHRRAYELLAKRLAAPRDVLDALGTGAIDEVRQDVLIVLLGEKLVQLCAATSPTAYALASFRNALRTQVRKWGPRNWPTIEARDNIEHVFHPDNKVAVYVLLDATRALRLAESLEGKGRLAVLLTTRPGLISERDWRELAALSPPPPPARPNVALNQDEASLLMYPPKTTETPATRKQRINTFEKVYRRALASIRAEMEDRE